MTGRSIQCILADSKFGSKHESRKRDRDIHIYVKKGCRQAKGSLITHLDISTVSEGRTEHLGVKTVEFKHFK